MFSAAESTFFVFYDTITPLCIWLLALNGVPYIGFSWRSLKRLV